MAPRCVFLFVVVALVTASDVSSIYGADKPAPDNCTNAACAQADAAYIIYFPNLASCTCLYDLTQWKDLVKDNQTICPSEEAKLKYAPQTYQAIVELWPLKG
ncbi:unnamed protein product, partial [Mesorhabditis spiculigera]